MQKFLFFLLFSIFSLYAKDKINFRSLDQIIITADYYKIEKAGAPLILLFHQAGWSRGEYIEIAPRLNKMGFNCLAIDQRSGNEVNNIDNETHEQAEKAGRSTTYLDGYIDMQAALNYASDSLGFKKVIVWGSSYSAALTFVLAAQNPQKIIAVLAFSPGEYFDRYGKSGHFIKDYAEKVTMPVFITSALLEQKNWKAIYDALPGKNKTYFQPDTKGNHGSRALWSKFKDSEKYWEAVMDFLEPLQK